MSDEMYEEAIKALARAAHGAGRLDPPSVGVRADNPFCGDRIALDARIVEGRIVALAHETRGCLLCRAAASLLAREAAGRTLADFAVAEARIAALLEGEGAPAAWPDLSVFSPVTRHRSRHGCVLLPFRALRKLIDEA